MKHLISALAAIGLTASCNVFAAFPAATNPSEVSVPQLPGGFFIGGSVNYVQPTVNNGDLDYASVNSGSFVNSQFTPFSSTVASVDPGYDWGWSVFAGYIFPNTGNDVTLNYFHIDTSDDSSVVLPTGTSFSPLGATVFVNAVTAINTQIGTLLNTFATSQASFHINQIDLTAGQLINVGCRLRLHPKVGLRWASIDQNTNANYGTPYFQNLARTTVHIFQEAATQSATSGFNGIGPVVGIDGSYYLTYGFGAIAHFDVAVLAGNISSSLNTTQVVNFQTFNPETEGPLAAVLTSNSSFSEGNNRRIVPIIDAKLGADYTWLFNNSANSDLTVEAGWQFSHYFNAVDYINATNATVTAVTSIVTSDVGLHGPYISLTLHV